VLAPESDIEFRSGTLASSYFGASRHATVSASSSMVVDAHHVEITGNQLNVFAHDQVSLTGQLIALQSEQGDVHLQTQALGNIDISVNRNTFLHSKRDITVRSEFGDVYLGSTSGFFGFISFREGLNIPQGSHLLIPAVDRPADDIDVQKLVCREGEIKYFRGFARTSFVSFPTQSYYRQSDRNGPKLCVCSYNHYICVNMG